MLRRLGPIRQNGYVVADIEAAMQHWTQVLGVGPFFYFERVDVVDFRYRGAPSEATFSIALANSGALQIELIQVRNDAPSMYRDFLRAGHEGLQHVACWTAQMDEALSAAAAAGIAIGQQGRIGPQGRFAYLETQAHPGTVLEVSEVSGPKGRFFEHVARCAQDWDGRDPVRPMASPERS